MNNTTNQEAINNFIQCIAEISDCVNSDYWNREDVTAILFTSLISTKRNPKAAKSLHRITLHLLCIDL